MASSSGKRTSSSNRTRKSTTNSRSRQAQRTAQDSELFHEIGLIVYFVVILVLSARSAMRSAGSYSVSLDLLHI